MKPTVLILRGLGTNSHEELGKSFELAGASVEEKHWKEVIEDPSLLDNYEGLGLAGGFAMGDQLGAGQSLANRIQYSGLRDKLDEKLEDSDFPVYAVCNSLQILAKLDLFPVALGTTKNDSGKHETGDWDLKINYDNKNIWLDGLMRCDVPLFAPISNGEGRIVMPQVDESLIALTYTKGHMNEYFHSSRGDRYNPNGSIVDIAGLGWNNNLVLFPHIERLMHNDQRSDKDHLSKRILYERYEPNKRMFKSAVEFMEQN